MKTKITLIFSIVTLLFSSCDDVLDRPQKKDAVDDIFWTSQDALRLYANEYYEYYFVGYGVNYQTPYTPLKGYIFNDDMVFNGPQADFELAIPSSRGDARSTASQVATPEWQSTYNGTTWNFAWIRKSNIMIDRINERMGNILVGDQKAHWIGVARFFRAMEYARLVSIFGDVPYFENEIASTDFNMMYKPRDPRNMVMDKVYEDLEYALNNVRDNDGEQFVNKYIVAAFASRIALFEGTWQKYHYDNKERAKKFLDYAVKTADIVRGSGKYAIASDFRSLFASEDLKGNKDCILYRHYDGAKASHSIATQANLAEVNSYNANLALIKSFICNDGNPYQNSLVTNADKFDITNLIKTRDSRFEATFADKPTVKANSSALYPAKFISRDAQKLQGIDLPAQYTASNNTNDYPIMRYSEVLLNWIEAKAELSTLGGSAVTQSDIDVSINEIRNRPLAAEAIAKGVSKTAPMNLATLPSDPAKDADVLPLIWEIRRERRMEFVYEHSRLLDIKRWKKIKYMSNVTNPDILLGVWVNIPVELPALVAANSTEVGKLAVVNTSGQRIVYNGNNASQMVGFYNPVIVTGRKPFEGIPGINVYLSPVGTNQRADYKNRGFVLAQTEGWSQFLK